MIHSSLAHNVMDWRGLLEPVLIWSLVNTDINPHRLLANSDIHLGCVYKSKTFIVSVTGLHNYSPKKNQIRASYREILQQLKKKEFGTITRRHCTLYIVMVSTIVAWYCSVVVCMMMARYCRVVVSTMVARYGSVAVCMMVAKGNL